MSSHPINLTLRFLLELSALYSMGLWGWQNGDGFLRFIFVIGIPIIAAAMWGTFRVPNDPGPAPVAVSGILRLVFELIFFGFATWALFDGQYIMFAWIFGIVIILHYITSYDRIIWLVKEKSNNSLSKFNYLW
jgi:hypothetical protein